MDNAPAYELPAPTQDERTMAVLAHALQFVGSFIAPLVIFLVKRDSKFTSFHALQALLLQITLIVCMVGTMVVFFAFFFAGIIGQSGRNPGPPPAIFVFFPLIWLVMFGGQITVLVLSIVYSIKAGRGEWAGYPVIGRIARSLLGLPRS